MISSETKLVIMGWLGILLAYISVLLDDLAWTIIWGVVAIICFLVFAWFTLTEESA